MKKAFVFLLLSLALSAVAAPVSIQRALAVAQHFWTHTLGHTSQLSLQPWQYPDLYLFAAPDGGFVVLSADDATRPVLAYSHSGFLAVDSLPVQFADRVDAFSQQIALSREQAVAPTPDNQARWLMQPSAKATKGDKSVAPLLETLWDQSPYYNAHCPSGTVAGCAAIAQAQLMRFYRFPNIGVGSHSYRYKNYYTLSADFGHTLYDWNHMPNQLTASSSNQEVQAVAKMVYHVGVSIDMDYNSAYNGGSGAYGILGMPGYPSMDNSLKDYFRYNPQMQAIFKDVGYNDQTWAQALMGELDLGQPVLYGGVSTAGGHAFVCDGYEVRDDVPYFHFNFGWSGVGDAYFTVDDISPNVSPTGAVGQTYTFNMQNSALLGCTPVYGLQVSDTLLQTGPDGGELSLLFSDNPQNSQPWTVASECEWLSVDDPDFAHAGTIHMQVSAVGSTLVERHGSLLFTQGSDTLRVAVVQSPFTDDQLCPLTVVMQARKGTGWRNGARLDFVGEAGYRYASASLANGSTGQTTVQVAPRYVSAVWHSGGLTDHDIDYTILNQHGDTLAHVEDARRNASATLIDWPCSPLAVDHPDAPAIRLAPNPVRDQLCIEGLAAPCRLQLVSMSGTVLLSQSADTPSAVVSTLGLPAGIYLLTVDGQPAAKIVKL